MRKDGNSKILHCYDIWTRGSGSSGGRVTIEDAVERWVRIRDDDSTSKSTANKEDPKPEVDGLECSLKVLAWIWRLPSQYGPELEDIFGRGARVWGRTRSGVSYELPLLTSSLCTLVQRW